MALSSGRHRHPAALILARGLQSALTPCWRECLSDCQQVQTLFIHAFGRHSWTPPVSQLRPFVNTGQPVVGCVEAVGPGEEVHVNRIISLTALKWCGRRARH